MVRGWVDHTVLTGTPHFSRRRIPSCTSNIAPLQVHPRRGYHFFAPRLSFWGSTFTTTMFAPPHSTNDRPSIVTLKTPSRAYSGSALSPMFVFATLKDVFLYIFIPLTLTLFRDRVHWRKLFEELRNVKVLRLHHGLEKKVADMRLTAHCESLTYTRGQSRCDDDTVRYYNEQ